ncbi:MAG: hypothetical protein ACRD8U_25565 [Pyrinomonadaceae bacterium]
MKTFLPCLFLMAVSCLLIGTAPMTVSTSISAAVPADNLSAATNHELARARSATAKYHSVSQAEADGYVNSGFSPGEGFEYVNEDLIDCDFDPAQPEILLYAFVPSDNHLRLVGVEYVVPLPCSQDAPEGFTGDSDVWREDSEGFGLWELAAWLWLHNSNGIFADPPHPRVP